MGVFGVGFDHKIFASYFCSELLVWLIGKAMININRYILVLVVCECFGWRACWLLSGHWQSFWYRHMMGKAEKKICNTPGIVQGKIYNLTTIFHLYNMCNKITAVLSFGFFGRVFVESFLSCAICLQIGPQFSFCLSFSTPLSFNIASYSSLWLVLAQPVSAFGSQSTNFWSLIFYWKSVWVVNKYYSWNHVFIMSNSCPILTLRLLNQIPWQKNYRDSRLLYFR